MHWTSSVLCCSQIIATGTGEYLARALLYVEHMRLLHDWNSTGALTARRLSVHRSCCSERRRMPLSVHHNAVGLPVHRVVLSCTLLATLRLRPRVPVTRGRLFVFLATRAAALALSAAS